MLSSLQNSRRLNLLVDATGVGVLVQNTHRKHSRIKSNVISAFGRLLAVYDDFYKSHVLFLSL